MTNMIKEKKGNRVSNILKINIVAFFLIYGFSTISQAENHTNEELITILTIDDQEAFDVATQDVSGSESALTTAIEGAIQPYADYDNALATVNSQESEIESATSDINVTQNFIQETQIAIDVAQELLDSAITDEDIIAATATLESAQSSLVLSNAELTELQGNLSSLQGSYTESLTMLNDALSVKLEAEAVVASAASDLSLKTSVFDLIQKEFDETSELINDLSNEQLDALYKSLKNVSDGKLIVNIDSQDLQLILDSNYTKKEINALTKGFEQEAKMLLKAEQLASQGLLDQANEFIAKANTEKQKFLNKAKYSAEKTAKKAEMKAAKKAEKESKKAEKKAAKKAEKESKKAEKKSSKEGKSKK